MSNHFKPRAKAIAYPADEKTMNRFWSMVSKSEPSECWVWQGSKSGGGYGRFRYNGKLVNAHRFSLVQSGQQVELHQVVDHLCRNRLCVNPAHLEAVVEQVNRIRGAASQVLSKKFEQQKVCVRGHPRTPENIWLHPKGYRYCKVCDRDRKRAAYKTRKTILQETPDAQ